MDGPWRARQKMAVLQSVDCCQLAYTPTPPTPLFLSTSGEKKGKSPIVSKGEGGLYGVGGGGIPVSSFTAHLA